MLVTIGVLVGLICGAGNGLLVAYFRLPSIVGTIGTMSLFRGIAFIILGDQAYGKYPADLAYFGQGYVWSVISFELALFIVAAIVYGFVLHGTSFGREFSSSAQIQRPLAIRAFASTGSSFSFFA